MKKILSFALIVLVLLSALSITSFAAKPQTADFVPATGFMIGGVRDVPTITQDADGAKVTFGGYYATGADCGGAITAQKVDMHGFEVTVRMDKVHTSSDCWIAFDFLIAQRAFYTDKFNAETGNLGIMNLIRQDRGTFNAINPAAWGISKTVTNDFFKFKTGDVVTLKVERTELGNYTYTFTKAGVADPVKVDYEYEVDEIFPDGKAYFSLFASSKDSPADAFEFTITDMKNGTAMTPTERQAIDAAKFARDAAEIINEANGRVTQAKTSVDKAVARAEATGDAAAIAKANEAATKLAAAKALVDAGVFNIEEVRALCTEATTLAYDANKLSAAAEKAAEAATETEKETEKQTEKQTEAKTEAPAPKKDEGFPVWAIGAIAGGVVVVAAVVFIIVRKKKQA